ncbi:integrin beta-1-like [Hippoglossus hippoglossus]|uniref:integrin beta-1-like n=1 Tax=Hippoglossus hippoglossus TaxID=8267 RepID=UPI00148D228D|nr:integrin beta-1-like [Hippoglossus hippoglossus]
MAVKLLCLCLLLALLCPSWARKQTCLTSASSCDECIQSGPECAWCTAPDPDVLCHSMKGLRRAGCHKSHIYNPQGLVQVVKNESSTEPAYTKTLFLQPQEFSVRLRPGVSQTFPLTITMPTEQPVPELTTDTTNVPAGVNITLSRVMTGHPLFVTVEAAQCPSKSDDSNQNQTGPWFVHITPRGFSLSVKLEISLDCQCDCSRSREESSVACSGHGALMCGQCECYDSYTGQNCQRDKDSSFSQNVDFCRSRPKAPVCSGRGECVDGFCECEARANPQQRYSGRFCECSNFDCPYANAKICGGHGMCECGRCLCDDDWTDEDCSCSMETASCMATNQQLCSGRGMCLCGKCKCEPPFTGPTCESCPYCQNTCQQHMECVECRAFGTGRKKDRCDQQCGSLSVTVVETRDDMPQPEENISFCKMISRHDSCYFYYTFSHTPSGGQSIVARAKDCPHGLSK